MSEVDTMAVKMETCLRQMVEMRRRMNETDQAPLPYVCQEDFVLKNGRAFKSVKLTTPQLATVNRAWKRDFTTPKHCFSNSQSHLALESRLGWRYVEGYCMVPRIPFPFLHGWLEWNGAVIDVTLRPFFKGEFKEPRAYFGVIFPTDFVVEKMLETEMVGSFIDDYERGWPALRGKYDDILRAMNPPRKRILAEAT